MFVALPANVQVVVIDTDPNRIKWLKRVVGRVKLTVLPESAPIAGLTSPCLIITNSVNSSVCNAVPRHSQSFVLNWSSDPTGFFESFARTPVTRLRHAFDRPGLEECIVSILDPYMHEIDSY